ncbi:hypothetical protein DLZ20_24335 [Salmonella enterica]|nr:hypothetical protein [Salmonella enterica]EAP0225365.1 hypothetical protein [Salmonella enterica]
MKMPAFEWVHVQLHQQKGMISLSPPTICNSAGAGLGLSITRSIIHAHGGELSAEQQGREIVFSVRLLMD